MAYQYNLYLKKINELLRDDPLYKDFYKGFKNGRSDFRIVQKVNKKVFDLTWVDVIEECLVPLDEIVRNPRKFIVIEEDIIDISLARSISVESVRHLAQHTNLIAMVDEKKGTVTPSKILNTAKEESYEVYENRFIYTLLQKVNTFINTRYDAIMKAVNQSDQIQILISSRYNIGYEKLQFKLDTIAKMSFDELMKTNDEGLTPVERVLRMRQILAGYLSSAFAKSMVSSSPVRPPITRTNVIKKNPNYKKALELWQFVESYNQKGFEMVVDTEDHPIEGHLKDDYMGLIFLNNLIIGNLSSKTLIEPPDFDSPFELLEPYDYEEDNDLTDKFKELEGDKLDEIIEEEMNNMREAFRRETSKALNIVNSFEFTRLQNTYVSFEIVKLNDMKKRFIDKIHKIIDHAFSKYVTSITLNIKDNKQVNKKKLVFVEGTVGKRLEEIRNTLIEDIMNQIDKGDDLAYVANQSLLKLEDSMQIDEMKEKYKTDVVNFLTELFDENLRRLVLSVDKENKKR